MSNIDNFLQSSRKSKFKRIVGKLLYGHIISGLEAVSLDINENSKNIKACSEQVEYALKTIELLRHDAENLGENVRVLNSKSTVLKNDFDNLCVNVRNNNNVIDQLSSELELSKTKLAGIQKNIKAYSNSGKSETISASDEKENVQQNAIKPLQDKESEYDSIDYFDFENHFRGSIESIKKSQSCYLKYFKDKENVVDIGCGRGEFLSLLKDNGINAKGVDVYEPYVDYCNMKGFQAICGDGVAYLDSLDSIDGIFVGQVVEHLQTHQIIRLCNTAFEKLTNGGCLVIETPNPTSLAIYTNAFYIDPSHVKPVHPLTLKYHLEKAGFKNTEIVYTAGSRPPVSIPELKCNNSDNINEFNQAMQKVSDIMFGSQDYAIIAVK